MKKFIFLLLIAVMAIVGDSYAAGPAITSKNDRAVVQLKNAASLSSFAEGTVLSSKKVMSNFEYKLPPCNG